MFDFKALAAPFPPEDISWRVGSTTKDKSKGMALAYLDARAVMDRLDAVCGPMGWQCRYSHASTKTVCDIGIKCGDEWVWKADGAGDSDIEAEKGALSDGFKRAAVRWGIGRYLYNLDSPWVELDEYKRIKKTEYAKLNAIIGKEFKAASLSSPRDFVSEALADGLVKNGDTRSTHEQTYVPVSQRVADRKAVALLNQTALLAIGTSSNRMELKAWWAENKPVLRKQLPEEDYLAVIAAVEARRDDLPAVEG